VIYIVNVSIHVDDDDLGDDGFCNDKNGVENFKDEIRSVLDDEMADCEVLEIIVERGAIIPERMLRPIADVVADAIRDLSLEEDEEDDEDDDDDEEEVVVVKKKKAKVVVEEDDEEV